MRQFLWLPNTHAWLNLDHIVSAEYETRKQASERLRVHTSGPHAFYLAGEDAELLDAALDMAGAEEEDTK